MTDSIALTSLIGIGLLTLLLVFFSHFLHVLKEYERAVVFTLGRFWAIKGPGLIVIIPLIQQAVRVDMRTVVMDVPPQDLISKDNVSVGVNAVVYFRIVDPKLAIIQVENYTKAVSQLAQTTLRSVLGEHELDMMLAERKKLNARIQEILDEHTDAWGIKVSMVEIKRVDINESMVRAIGRQAEAERERRAQVIHADGELQASQKLLEAAQVLAKEPQSLQLRYLQTLSTMGEQRNATVVVPLPLDLLRSFVKTSGS